MSISVNDVADDLLRANDELIAFVESCDDAAWKATVPGDEWSVAADAHHCAVGHRTAMGWIEHMRRGDDVPGSRATHDEGNANHAEEYAEVGREETVALLRANGAEAARFLRGIRDDELAAQSTHGPAGGVTLSVAQMAAAFPGHVLAHLARMRVAVAGEAAAATSPARQISST
jgi:hypothetical protein